MLDEACAGYPASLAQSELQAVADRLSEFEEQICEAKAMSFTGAIIQLGMLRYLVREGREISEAAPSVCLMYHRDPAQGS